MDKTNYKPFLEANNCNFLMTESFLNRNVTLSKNFSARQCFEVCLENRDNGQAKVQHLLFSQFLLFRQFSTAFQINYKQHCVRSVQTQSFSGPNTGKYGPEKTPYLDTFHTESHRENPVNKN